MLIARLRREAIKKELLHITARYLLMFDKVSICLKVLIFTEAHKGKSIPCLHPVPVAMPQQNDQSEDRFLATIENLASQQKSMGVFYGVGLALLLKCVPIGRIPL